MYQWNTFYFEAITLIPFYELEKTDVGFAFTRVGLQKNQYLLIVFSQLGRKNTLQKISYSFALKSYVFHI
jgi:hypothetical protein